MKNIQYMRKYYKLIIIADSKTHSNIKTNLLRFIHVKIDNISIILDNYRLTALKLVYLILNTSS